MSAKIDWYGEKIPSPTDSLAGGGRNILKTTPSNEEILKAIEEANEQLSNYETPEPIRFFIDTEEDRLFIIKWNLWRATNNFFW